MAARFIITERPLMSRPTATSSGWVARRASSLTRMSPSGHHLAPGVGHLDPDGLLARDRRQDAHVGRRHRVRDVLVEAGDPVDLHARAQLELEAGDGRADDHADQPGLDPVVGERLLERAAGVFDGLAVDLLAAGALEQRDRRQLPGRRPPGRAERQLDLLGRRLVGLGHDDLGPLALGRRHHRRGVGVGRVGVGHDVFEGVVGQLLAGPLALGHGRQLDGVVVVEVVDADVGLLGVALGRRQHEQPGQAGGDHRGEGPDAGHRAVGRHLDRRAGEHDDARHGHQRRGPRRPRPCPARRAAGRPRPRRAARRRRAAWRRRRRPRARRRPGAAGPRPPGTPAPRRPAT